MSDCLSVGASVCLCASTLHASGNAGGGSKGGSSQGGGALQWGWLFAPEGYESRTDFGWDEPHHSMSIAMLWAQRHMNEQRMPKSDHEQWALDNKGLRKEIEAMSCKGLVDSTTGECPQAAYWNYLKYPESAVDLVSLKYWSDWLSQDGLVLEGKFNLSLEGETTLEALQKVALGAMGLGDGVFVVVGWKGSDFESGYRVWTYWRKGSSLRFFNPTYGQLEYSGDAQELADVVAKGVQVRPVRRMNRWRVYGVTRSQSK